MLFPWTRHVARALFVSLFTVVSFCATRARAENTGPDRVTLRNGHTFQGTMQLVEVDASFVKMTLDDGKVITIPSNEISGIERTGPDLPAVSAPAAKNDEVPEGRGTGEVHVTFVADDGVALEQREGPRDRWRTVCRGHCTELLPLDATYRVGGGDARSSGVFRLIGKDGDHVVVTTTTHSRGAFALGITLTSAGSLATLISVSAMGSCPSSDDSCKGARFGGAVAALVSAGVTVLGTALIATNPSSKVSQKLQPGAGSFLALATSSPRLEQLAASRAPIAWRPTTPQFAPPPRASTLFTIHF